MCGSFVIGVFLFISSQGSGFDDDDDDEDEDDTAVACCSFCGTNVVEGF